jgi:hypothetical protein
MMMLVAAAIIMRGDCEHALPNVVGRFVIGGAAYCRDGGRTTNSPGPRMFSRVRKLVATLHDFPVKGFVSAAWLS